MRATVFFALWDPATEEYSYTRDGSFVVSMFTVPLEEGEEPELDADGNEILEKTVWYLSDGDGRFVLSNEGRLIGSGGSKRAAASWGF